METKLIIRKVSTERWRGGHGNRVGAKLTAEAQKMNTENTISISHCVIPLGKGFLPPCSVVSMEP